MVELIDVNREKESATFKLTATNKVPWDEMAEAIFDEVGDDKYFNNFFNLRRYDTKSRVADSYGRWEKELVNPFPQTEIPTGTYEIPFDTVFGFCSEDVFSSRSKLIYYTRYQRRWDNCGNQYSYPWMAFTPDEYKLPKWSYDESTASQIQKAKRLVAEGNVIDYPAVDYMNYIVEVDPRTLEYDSDTDLSNNPYTLFHFWNEDVWVGIPTNLQQEEKIYIRFFVYHELWGLGKMTIGGDPLEIHSIVYTAEKYQRFLSEEPGEKKQWVKY